MSPFNEVSMTNGLFTRKTARQNKRSLVEELESRAHFSVSPTIAGIDGVPQEHEISFSLENVITTTNQDGIPTSGTGWATAYSHNSTVYHNVIVGQVSLPATDADNHALTYSVATGPAHGTLMFDTSSGLFIEELNSGFQGFDHFTYTVTDGIQTSAPINVNVTLNVPMVARSLQVQFSDWVLTLDAPADLDTLQVDSNFAPLHGYVEMYNRDMLYLPTDSGPSDSLNLTWTLLGIQGKSINVVFQANAVTASGGIAQCPVALIYDVANDTATSFSSSATNIASFSSTQYLELATGPTHGTLSIGSTGGLTYTPTVVNGVTYRGWDFAQILIEGDGDTYAQWIQFNVGPN